MKPSFFFHLSKRIAENLTGYPGWFEIWLLEKGYQEDQLHPSWNQNPSYSVPKSQYISPLTLAFLSTRNPSLRSSLLKHHHTELKLIFAGTQEWHSVRWRREDLFSGRRWEISAIWKHIQRSVNFSRMLGSIGFVIRYKVHISMWLRHSLSHLMAPR